MSHAIPRIKQLLALASHQTITCPCMSVVNQPLCVCAFACVRQQPQCIRMFERRVPLRYNHLHTPHNHLYTPVYSSVQSPAYTSLLFSVCLSVSQCIYVYLYIRTQGYTRINSSLCKCIVCECTTLGVYVFFLFLYTYARTHIHVSM